MNEEKTAKTVGEIAAVQRAFKREKENGLGKASFAYMEIVESQIELPKEFHKALKIQSRLMKNAEFALRYHTEQLRKQNDRLWRTIEAACPGLDFEKFSYNFHHKKMELHCIGESPK